MAPTFYPQRPCREPLFDVHPQTGALIEVFYADRTLETFGRGGSGWFWWNRRRGFSPDGPATGPFSTSYAAYRDALLATGFESQFGDQTNRDKKHNNTNRPVAVGGVFHAWGSRAKFACVRRRLFDGYWTTLDGCHQVIEMAGAP